MRTQKTVGIFSCFEHVGFGFGFGVYCFLFSSLLESGQGSQSIDKAPLGL